MKTLSFLETRILGCLIEKSLTTPEQYPLSLNSLTTACNQKSNREPVVELSEAEVQDGISGLVDEGLASTQSGFGSRVEKYKHRFCNTQFSELQMSERELGITCVLFLRGPQTPGELRTRTNRLCNFDSLEQVESTLDGMANRQWVKKLPREPGKREARYAHLFGTSDESEVSDVVYQSTPVDSPDNTAELVERISKLEATVDLLESRVRELETLLND